MGLQPVNHLLQKLISKKAWAHQQRFQQITQLWQQILPEKSQINSRPFNISNNILWIATINTTWSQHLNLQRLRLLKQLNTHLTVPLEDIRFSAAHWHQAPAYSPLADLDSPHPSRIPPAKPSPKRHPQEPAQAVQQWLIEKQQRLNQLPLCPRCHVPTPVGELTRWHMCSCCMAQQWHQSYLTSQTISEVNSDAPKEDSVDY